MSNDLSADKRELSGEIAGRVAGLSPAKRKLLELRFKEQKTEDLGRLTIPRLADRKALPLSFAQQRLWFFDQVEPGSSVYNVSSVFRLRGMLDVTALEKSLDEILRRHEVLRTSFPSLDQEPVQVIADRAPPVLSVLELDDVPETERENKARQLAFEETRRPFDLAKGPLFRAKLLRLSGEDHVLAMTVHHIVCDGWSMGIFHKELATLYEAFRSGKPSPLEELPVQYADFAVWQREWLQGGALEQQLSYWKQQLKDAPPTLELPTDHPRPAVQTFRGASESCTFSSALVRNLRAVSRKSRVTLFMTLLAAFKILLQRQTGQDDVVVGSPIAGRNRAETEGLIGFFVNMVALRTDLSDNPTFLELLDRVRTTALNAYAHQDLPFDKLVEELQPERDLSRTPLFQVFFNMLGLGGRNLEVGGLVVEPLSGGAPDSKFDMTVYVRERKDEVQLRLVYNADLFRPERMRALLEQYVSLLSQIVENPERKIHSLSLVTPGAKKFLPEPTQPLRPKWPVAVHSRFSAQAERARDRIAVRGRQAVWTYGELESRSNQIANCLLSNGIRRGDIVAVYAGRCASLVAALLGVLKAGGAFLILDATYPPGRLIEYLRIAKPRGWIGLGEAGKPPDGLEEFVSAITGLCRVTLPQWKNTGRHGLLNGYSEYPSSVSVDPADRAYVAFTSGTSGVPKAVEGTHGPLSHFLEWHCETFGLSEGDRFSMLSGLSHDPLLRDIFTPLWLGGTLCIPDLESMSPGDLARWMKREKISVVHLTPAMGEFLAEGASAGGGLSTSLRYAFFGGDTLNELHVARMKQLAPAATCVNFYGATETPQAMGCFVVPERTDTSRAASDKSKRIVPLGRGIEGVQLLVLNRAGQLAGIGELGEVCIRTPYLAKGYIEDEALTRDRFPVNPFTGASGDRVYRTGDGGRYLPDGTVEFAGRNDRQVKIRAFRIELGEIEAALTQHPAVQTAAVVAAGGTGGDARLVGYVVSNEEPKPTSHELRKFLKRTLPEHMIPDAFVALDAFPRTPNGKVDRKALPEPDGLVIETGQESVPPRTAMEKLIAEVWQEVLGVDRVGVHDNFFDFGGHSLLSVKVITQIERKTGQRIHPREMVYQTLGQLAAACERGRSAICEDAPKGLGRRLMGALKEMLNRSQSISRR